MMHAKENYERSSRKLETDECKIWAKKVLAEGISFYEYPLSMDETRLSRSRKNNNSLRYIVDRREAEKYIPKLCQIVEEQMTEILILKREKRELLDQLNSTKFNQPLHEVNKRLFCGDLRNMLTPLWVYLQRPDFLGNETNSKGIVQIERIVERIDKYEADNDYLDRALD